MLVVLRCLQGLAIGGKYGGAVTYVAEHAPPGKRGLYTSFIQATGSIGLLLSLLIIIIIRSVTGEDSFKVNLIFMHINMLFNPI
jgi:MFS family permease